MDILRSIVFDEVSVGRHHDMNTSANRMSKLADKVTMMNPKVLQYVEIRLETFRDFMKNKRKK